LSSRAGVREKVRGGCWFSSLMKQNKRGKICFVIYIAGFFLKTISVMKCLRSKKRLNGAEATTCVCVCVCACVCGACVCVCVCVSVCGTGFRV
jgi:hypothetical protein